MGIFIDFSKAFDTVNHTILLQKPCHYGVNCKELNWFKSYLTNRQQCVKLNTVISGYLPVTCGVSQGSILGPMLFLIYVNELPNILKQLNTILHADDTNLFYNSKPFSQETLDALNKDLGIFYQCTVTNKLTLNFSKTHAMTVPEIPACQTAK